MRLANCSREAVPRMRMMLCEAQAAADKQKQGNAVQAGRRRKREVRTKPKQVARRSIAPSSLAGRAEGEARAARERRAHGLFFVSCDQD